MKQIFTAIFFSGVCGIAPAQPAFDKAKADSLFDGLEKNDKLMGAVSIRREGVPLYERAIGFADKSATGTQANNGETRFRVGSVSKIFTSTLILGLVEEGRLSLDTKLSEFFPKIPDAQTVTIAQLLSHSSGVHNFTNDKSYVTYYTKPQTHEQMLRRFAKNKPDFTPGSKHDYSNAGFILLGYIVEKVTGKPYGEYLQERIVKPLGLKHTGYGGKIDPSQNQARSYERVKGAWAVTPETDMSIPHGAGAVVSTPGDLGMFVEGLFAGKLLKKETLDKMTTIRDGYGFGIFKLPFGEKTAYGHGGSIDGFRSQAAFFPKENLAVAFCANGLDYPQNDVLIGLLKISFGQAYTVPDFRTVAVASDVLARYAGIYGAENFPLKITLSVEEGKLVAQATGQAAFELDAVNDTEFAQTRYGIRIKMKVSSGPAEGFHFSQGGQEFDFKREK